MVGKTQVTIYWAPPCAFATPSLFVAVTATRQFIVMHLILHALPNDSTKLGSSLMMKLIWKRATCASAAGLAEGEEKRRYPSYSLRVSWPFPGA